MNSKKLPIGLKIIRRGFICLFSLFLLPLYYFIGFLPRDKNLWVFCSWFGQRYSDNSRILYEYVNTNCPEIKAIWLSKNKSITLELKKKGLLVFSSYSLKGFLYSLRAGKIFSTTGLEISLFFCRGAEYYALWHGMPLKRILNDDKHSGGTSYKNILNMKTAKILRLLFPWNSFLDQKKLFTVTNSDFFVPFLQTAFNLPKERILKTGSPRCDAFFYNNKEPLVEQIRETFPNSKIILYMPTFRTSSWTEDVFNPFSTKYGFNLDEMLNVLELSNTVLVYKPHFYDAAFMQTTNNKDLQSRFITISDDNYNELYNFVGQMDILVTDYSSIYFDFLCLNKPVILLPFDYDYYTHYCRGHYFDYATNIEGAKAENWQEFYRILTEKKYSIVNETTIMKFAQYLNGNCCEKLINQIVNN